MTTKPLDYDAIQARLDAITPGVWTDEFVDNAPADIDALLKAVDAAQVTIRAYELNHRHMDRLQALFGDDWNTTGKSLAGRAADTIEAQRKQIAELETALGFYANKNAWLPRHTFSDYPPSFAEQDRGARARKARGEGE